MAKLHRPHSLDELLNAVEADGRSGLIRTVARQIGQSQPSFECIQESDNCFQGALTADDVWDCALDQAICLIDARMSPEVGAARATGASPTAAARA